MTVDNIIDYITSKVSSDTDISDVGVCEAYKYAHEIHSPAEIQVAVINDIEHVRGTTFAGEKVSAIAIQITIYARQMTIAQTEVSAQRATELLSEKVKAWMRKGEASFNGLLNITRNNASFSEPLDSGTNIYRKVIRFEALISTD